MSGCKHYQGLDNPSARVKKGGEIKKEFTSSIA